MQLLLNLITKNWKTIAVLLVGFFGLSFGSIVCAEGGNQLTNVELRTSEQNKIQLRLEFSEAAVLPKSFSVEAPPTVVLDFPSVKNKISKEVVNQIMSVNLIRSVNIAESEDKTRVAIDVQHLVPFETDVNGNILTITFETNMGEMSFSRGGSSAGNNEIKSVGNLYQVRSFDFHRGEHGEARIIVDLSTSKAMVNFKEETEKVTAEFIGATLQSDLAKRYDVTDFATPVQSILVEKKGNNVNFVVNASGDFDKIAYQMDNQFILEIRGLSQEEKAVVKEATPRYTGEKISLNFQNIDIRAILQIIADFSGFNIITNDTVKGNITLRLQNVPWDQALDIILKSKGLGKRQSGNVFLVGPAEQIAASEKVELEGLKQVEDLGPMKSELIQVNYASAPNLATILKDKATSLLTSRGTVTVDKRTNTLLIQDVDSRLSEIKALLKKLDRPVRQVEISTQIVSASSSLEKNLGIRLGGGANMAVGRRRLGVGSTVDRARAIAENTGGVMPPPNAVIGSEAYNSNASLKLNDTEGLFTDLGAATITGVTTGTAGFALARLPNGTLLDLELQALEYELNSKTIARPKLVTQDQTKASVEQGVDVAYQQASSSGATTVAYKSAALKLEVTPQISPDNKITLDLSISNDKLSTAISGAAPAVDTNRLKTKVLVDNGETVVLGGVLKIDDERSMAKIPFFGDLPLIGGLFRNKHYKYQPRELIIFITPKIIDPLKVSDNG